MKVEFRTSFLKDVQSIKDRSVLSKLKQTVLQVESADTLDSISNLKKLRGGKGYFRVRVGDFRAGLHLDNDVIYFVRFLNRKDIYRYFP